MESQGLYGARDVHGRQVQYTDRELSASSPVLLQLYDAIKVCLHFTDRIIKNLKI